MTDLTDLKTPFGLLDRDTQEALKAHGGPYVFWHWAHDDWRIPDNDEPSWHKATVYRVKPAPPKPREWWLTIDRNGSRWVYTQPVRSDDHEVIHVREVLPE